MKARFPGGPTALLTHGANPGMVSHFVKQGLIDIGESLIADKKLKPRAAANVAALIATRQFNHLARAIGVKVIHCSERDTQITDPPKQIDESLVLLRAYKTRPGQGGSLLSGKLVTTNTVEGS